MFFHLSVDLFWLQPLICLLASSQRESALRADGGRGKGHQPAPEGRDNGYFPLRVSREKQLTAPPSPVQCPLAPRLTRYHKSTPCSHLITLNRLLAPFLKPAKLAFGPEHPSCGDPQPLHPLSHSYPGPKKDQDLAAICTRSCLESTQSPGFYRKPFKQHPEAGLIRYETSQIRQTNPHTAKYL